MAVASDSTAAVELVLLDRVHAVRNLRASLTGIPELAEDLLPTFDGLERSRKGPANVREAMGNVAKH